MNKKKISILVGILIVALAITVGGIKFKDYAHWRAPMYNTTEKGVLLSNRVNKLNKDQENAFYDIAKGAIKSQNPKMEFTNLDDDSLYVEKLGKKNSYFISYVCMNPTLKIRFKTDVNVKLKNESLKGETNFKYWGYKSDLDKY